jgi:hypothetical protein
MLDLELACLESLDLTVHPVLIVDRQRLGV